MATNVEPLPTTEIEVEKLDQMHADLRRLNTELEQANLRTEVALYAVPLLHKLVEDHQSRGIVVADIAACWLRLSPEVQQKYQTRSHAVTSAVGQFTCDYFTEALDGWLPKHSFTETDLHDTEAREMDRLQWSIHIAQVRQRNILGKPPHEDWLVRFPTPNGGD
jgi:hypothetical protein